MRDGVGSFVADHELMISYDLGYAYQQRAVYDDAYYDKYVRYEDTAIGRALNAARLAFLMRHVPENSTVLDVGCASGAFVRAARFYGYECCGYDVMARAAEMMRTAGTYSDLRPASFDALTFWDSLEHMDDPRAVLTKVKHGSCVLVSIPVFNDLRELRQSKHYRPGEHLHYWTECGFILWMEKIGFRVLEVSDHEVKAGRESIGAFAFRRE